MEKNNEVLEIKTSNEDFFYKYLLLKKPILETILSMINKKKVKLSPKILKVFSILLYYNNLYKDMNDKEKNEIVFGEESRNKIIQALDITQSHLNTYLSILRNIKILNGNAINKPFIIYPDNNYELTFRFNINHNEK